MIDAVTTFCGGVLTLAILGALIRMVRGPSTLDRILAFDLITICAVGLMGILSIRWNTEYFLELILIFTLLGFFGTVAFVFYLQQTFPAYPSQEEGETPPPNTKEGDE